ncbi:DUF58 domain-containing protein [Paenibacillaceae bacterium]|nr:DUF58 domain-containing protein [Paenibacillaceae bacterium]
MKAAGMGGSAAIVNRRRKRSGAYQGSLRRTAVWLLLASGWCLLLAAVRLRGGAVEWFCLAALSLIMLTSAAAPWLSLRRLSMQRSIQSDQIQEGGTLEVSLRFQSAIVQPFIWIAVREEIVNETTQQCESFAYRRLLLPWLKRRWQLTYQIAPLRRGELRFLPLEIYAGDLFGCHIRRLFLDDATASALVLAGPAEDGSLSREASGLGCSVSGGRPDGSGATNRAGDGWRSQQRLLHKAGMEPELRPYLSGDPLRAVDWRGAAKGRAMQTRRSAADPAGEQLIVLDGAAASYAGDERLFDACASRAQWAVERQLSAGGEVRLLCAGERTVELRSSPMQTARFREEARQCLARTQLGDGMNLLGLVRRASEGAPRGSTIVCVTTGLSDWTNAAQYAAANGWQLKLWLVVRGSQIPHELHQRLLAQDNDDQSITVWTTIVGEIHSAAFEPEGGGSDAATS